MSDYNADYSYKFGHTYTNKERKDYFKYAVEKLKIAKNVPWDSNIVEFKNGSCRVNYSANKNIWFSIRPADSVNSLGIEIKLVMTNALRFTISQMQNILDAAYQISKVCESNCTIYKE